ncbi:Hydrogenase expression-formation protein HypB [Halorhabdus tiamatea SARL4B]|uniref:Hydrogenase expression-formation protein HypB n=1 Tax=Halorhabdus tiamatea SARL4B TaxID=1033806 RepID=F7PPJ5_9EURY|nr:hydrogenase nickel incorporation protein HypB [Halorhabdus tiamatea]ERJ04553.1 Hydrogenase expression-formation protein HypB [Halorhabdus tiamatea SARL4B]ERJ06195.1 Hydrogenase expression-formation protein HypB [Halorhabdus tiamatea SARL4B]CCQ34027.1 [NiFe] hydrogenase nickel incorporation-associated protein HypB [Halorhabdus tiamatea SARL4B]
MYHTHRHPRTDAPSIDRLLDRLLGESGILGPLGAHRMGHGDDHDHGDSDAEADILAQFEEQAENLHERVVHDHGVFVAEFLGATGSGKTRLIERLIERAPDDEEIGVIVGDVAGEDDATRFRELGVSVANVNTGKECHLDPGLVEGAFEDLDLDALDTLYIENVGNMVCPADFPLGAQARVLVVSATEGDDVVRKHPLLFQACDGAVINKVDIAGAVNADLDTMEGDVSEIAPEMPTFRTSAEHGDGLDALAAFLDERGHVHASDHEAYVAETAHGHSHEHTHADGQTHEHEHTHENAHDHTHADQD